MKSKKICVRKSKLLFVITNIYCIFVPDDEAAEFLRLEKEKIENARKLHETVLTLTSEITRLTDVISHIRDVIVGNRINL